MVKPLVKISLLHAFILLSCGVSGIVHAYDAEKIKEVIGQEYAECTAYFSIISVMSERGGLGNKEKEYAGYSLSSIELGTKLGNVQYILKSEIAGDTVMKMVHEKDGFSRLMHRYDARCKDMIKNPSGWLEYYKEMQ